MKHCWGIVLSLLISSGVSASSELDFLARLTEAPGASGFEKPIRHLLQSEWAAALSDMKVDGQGNLIGRYKNSQQGPKLLLMAHMDEIGFMVESITDDGFLKVLPLGGISNAVIFAQRWQVNTAKGPVMAYSGMDSPHIMGDKKLSGSADLKALFMDIGASSREQAMKDYAVRPGLSITPKSELTPLGKYRVLGKALDDRIGLALITETLSKIKSKPLANQLYVAANVQEEIGLRGAATVYKSTHPDVVINVEVGIADDYPQLLAERKGRVALGKGPSVFVYDASMIPNQDLLDWVLELAKKNNIQVQLESEPGYGEDGAKLQTSGAGAAVINIGIPIRYAHQQASVFDQRDYQQALRLLTLIVENFNQKVSEQIKAG